MSAPKAADSSSVSVDAPVLTAHATADEAAAAQVAEGQSSGAGLPTKMAAPADAYSRVAAAAFAAAGMAADAAASDKAPEGVGNVPLPPAECCCY